MNLSNGIRISGSDLAKLDATGGTSPEARKRHEDAVLERARAADEGRVARIGDDAERERAQYLSMASALARARQN